MIACKRQCLHKAGVLQTLFSLKLLHSGPVRNPCFNRRGSISEPRRVGARKQAGQARTAVANHMQQMQDEYPGIQAPTPLQILNTGYGEDIADFCVSFYFLFLVPAQGSVSKRPQHIGMVGV